MKKIEKEKKVSLEIFLNGKQLGGWMEKINKFKNE